MPVLLSKPSIIEAAGNKPKIIREVFGRVNSADTAVSIAHMSSPEGWVEPGQTPEFDEYTYVLHGTLRVEHHGGVTEVQAGQGIHTAKGEWIRYSSPSTGGAEYIAVCLPAFSPATVRRDA
jgi:mannose-6-phosphate isomerase-like protein (cupin superfamily)